MNRRQALLAASAALGSVGTALLAEPALGPGLEACELKGTPLEDMHLHLCAFHVAKDDPKLQLEAHHYCMPLVKDKVFQCIVTDSNKPGARILGIEYIVTKEIYQEFDAEEKKFWHPHDYEVTSGLLVAPALSEEKENELMAFVKTTWGKTFHTWPDPSQNLPLGKPILMWAFGKDGQIREELVKKRDENLGISTAKIKKRRSGI
jgi:hypothetical protein